MDFRGVEARGVVELNFFFFPVAAAVAVAFGADAKLILTARARMGGLIKNFNFGVCIMWKFDRIIFRYIRQRFFVDRYNASKCA